MQSAPPQASLYPSSDDQWRVFLEYGTLPQAGTPLTRAGMKAAAPSIVFENNNESFIRDRGELASRIVALYPPQQQDISTQVDLLLRQYALRGYTSPAAVGAQLAWIRWLLLKERSRDLSLVKQILKAVQKPTKLNDAQVGYLRDTLYQFKSDTVNTVGDSLHRFVESSHVRRQAFIAKINTYKWSTVRDPPQKEVILDPLDKTKVLGTRKFYQDIRDEIEATRKKLNNAAPMPAASDSSVAADGVRKYRMKLADEIRALKNKESYRIQAYKNFQALEKSIRNDPYLDEFIKPTTKPEEHEFQKKLFLKSLNARFGVPIQTCQEAMEEKQKKRRKDFMVTGTQPERHYYVGDPQMTREKSQCIHMSSVLGD